MKNFNYKVKKTIFSGDMHTPVSIYLKVRDLFPLSALLECTDYHSDQNSCSYIALCPIAAVSINNYSVKYKLPDSSNIEKEINANYNVEQAIKEFMSLFNIDDSSYGLWGYTAYDSVKYLENIKVNSKTHNNNDAPDIYYVLYKYILEFDHFHNVLSLKELLIDKEISKSERIISAIESRNFAIYDFESIGDVESTITDSKYIKMVEEGIEHCKKGDVFQIVLSRKFMQKFKGEDFNVYRKLRRINPSPYLFYFDFGGIKIFGSSPETHCKIDNNIITIDPIAGTAFRTGDINEDKLRADALSKDPKENAEHVMLVDLARNDLSRNAKNVKVEIYKELQYFSHVIHLVSRVSGELSNNNYIKSYLDTFPAGTLSGAPKVRAMELINKIEPHNRGIYGGAIGYIGFNGKINHAITIRTFVSRNNVLEFQAGAGIVALSNPERELLEVNSKLGALSKALKTNE